MRSLDVANLDRFDILQLENYLSINSKDFKLLIEAYRRKNLVGEIKSYDSELGVGSPHSYKSKYFRPAGLERLGKNNSYKLTEKGEQMLRVIESYLPIPLMIEVKTREKINHVLYKFS